MKSKTYTKFSSSIPILFTIFINNLDIYISSHMKVFADDTRIYNTTILQDDLHKLYEWSNKLLLLFSIHKCCILHYGKHNNIYNNCVNNQRIMLITLLRI